MSAPIPAGLDRVLTIPQVARLAGWSDDRMRAHLVALNEEMHGMLLRNVSRGNQRPRWTITLRALQSVSPQWFLDRETIIQRLEELEHRVRRVENVQTMHTERLVAMGR